MPQARTARTARPPPWTCLEACPALPLPVLATGVLHTGRTQLGCLYAHRPRCCARCRCCTRQHYPTGGSQPLLRLSRALSQLSVEPLRSRKPCAGRLLLRSPRTCTAVTAAKATPPPLRHQPVLRAGLHVCAGSSERRCWPRGVCCWAPWECPQLSAPSCCQRTQCSTMAATGSSGSSTVSLLSGGGVARACGRAGRVGLCQDSVTRRGQ